MNKLSVISPAYAARLIFRTRRGLRTLVAHLLAAAGLVSAVVQFLGQMFFSKAFPAPVAVTVLTLFGCFAWAVSQTYPRSRIEREFSRPDTTVRIQVGDLFEQDTHLVVGFTDTFDTSVTNDRIISSAALQGQLLHRRYGDDQRRLDRELAAALRRIRPVMTEPPGSKAGKRTRYPIGTIAVVGTPGQHIFATAYSRLGNDLVPRSSVDDIWVSLNRLWAAVYERAERRPLSLPIIGSGLARIDELDRESLLKLILISFLARSREMPICRELRVIIHPDDLHSVDLLEVRAFLRAL
ncbi:macro domain-containing protein [Micromonospora wenchangensis]|uniref:macro domain-containing protein n=1 Tax=Micromonospora wenchangensis TaxID=1185415 RepID=UPI0033C69FC3